MNAHDKKIIAATLGVIVVLAATAGAASYFTRSSMTDEPSVTAQAVHHPANGARMAAMQPAAGGPPPCNDHNIVGTVGGGLTGGVVGNQFGKGSGKTLTTVGGAVGGAVLGNEYLPTRNVTCR